MQAQDNVQWASRVIEFSSELTPIQYSAEQVLGKPNVLPAAGESPSAWTPDRPNRQEFLKVGFENPQKIRHSGQQLFLQAMPTTRVIRNIL